MTKTISLLRWIDKNIFGIKCVLWGLFQRKKQFKKGNKVAFVKLWALGDSILTLPLIKQFKKKGFVTTVIATNRNKQIYTNLDYVDEIIELNTNNFFQLIFRRRFDLVFDLEPYLNISALLSRTIGRITVGFSGQKRSKLYNYKSVFFKDKHIVETYLEMGKPFGITKVNKLEKIGFSEEDKKKAEDFLKQNKIKGTIIGLCVGAAESVRERIWPKERFAELADYLIQKHKVQIIFFGSPKEQTEIEEVRTLMKNESTNAAGKISLKQAIYTISKCKVFISNDTGPMHIAAAQGCKVIGLFGPNTPKRWAPYGKGNISLYHPIECSPCIINEKGKMPACINKEFQKCMKLITVEEVEKAVERLLK